MQKLSYAPILYLLCILLLASAFISACKHSPDERAADRMKFDAPLRSKLAQMERDDDRSPVSCFIELEEALNEDKREKIEEAGVKIKSVVENIITVEGDPDSIRRCAELEFVKSISLSMVRRPLE